MSTAVIHNGSIAIRTKPSVPMAYSFIESAQQLRRGPATLVIFCSGLCDPRKVWNPTVTATVKLLERKHCPPMLLYDRFGSGETGKDPTDEGKYPKNTHDVMDAARDLRELLICVAEMHLAIPESKINDVRLVFVAHSMGAAVAEIYAKAYPKTVAALLVLDGTPTVSDGLVWYPDPDAPDFCLAALPKGITPEVLRKARAQQRASIYNPNTINGEGLRWINLRDYIPTVGAPKLQGPIPGTPLLTVVAHDPVPYAKQVKKLTGLVEVMALNYNSPQWFQYLEEFSNLVDPRLRKGPFVAKGSGHFIPLQRPELVAAELSELLEKLFCLYEEMSSKL